MMTRDERLLYWEKIEAARASLLSDPEIAAEYYRASRAWNSTVGAKTSGDQPEQGEDRRPASS